MKTIQLLGTREFQEIVVKVLDRLPASDIDGITKIIELDKNLFDETHFFTSSVDATACYNVRRKDITICKDIKKDRTELVRELLHEIGHHAYLKNRSTLRNFLNFLCKGPKWNEVIANEYAIKYLKAWGLK